jgi:hypothetical protein
MCINVDREELLNALQYDRGQYEKGYRDGQRDGQRWIPCSERFPEEEQKVFVSLESASGEKFVRYDRIRDGKWWLFETESVKAWMPLPEPYREEE